MPDYFQELFDFGLHPIELRLLVDYLCVNVQNLHLDSAHALLHFCYNLNLLSQLTICIFLQFIIFISNYIKVFYLVDNIF